MCGIFGYKSKSFNAGEIVLSGLKKLDYRGYDSWGVAVLSKKQIYIQKDVGSIDKISQLKLPESSLALGHTRWATNGAVTKSNAHPHFASDKTFALVQNGIVENCDALKNILVSKGFEFNTETDTEVIVRLIEDELRINKNFFDSFRSAFLKLKGRNTVAVLNSQDSTIYAARNGSPLVVGRDNFDNLYISSDILSMSLWITEVLDIYNGEGVVIGDSLKLINLKTGKIIKRKFRKVDIIDGNIDKGKYEHFMIKEIFETPDVIRQVIQTDYKNLINLSEAIKKSRCVYTIGSGTAGNAAANIALFLRKYAKINAISLIGADCLEYIDLMSEKDLLIAPSQSGETADVIEILEIAKKIGCKIATYVNMTGSLMTKIADYSFLANAGPEICVMSTKVFSSQVAWGYLLSQTVAGRYSHAIKMLQKTAELAETYLSDHNSHLQIKSLAQKLLPFRDIFILGKSENFNIAKEGMVKLVEGTYKHAHAIPAGDLKHYAITLIEPGVQIISLVSDDETFNDMTNAINEIKSRNGSIIGIYPEKLNSFDVHIKVPRISEVSSILNMIPLQLLSYYLAYKLGNNIDKPRNIAKSVTVK
jgi:glucosamine--fructose-6-phosphate aminotransferase (isomerizing)